MAGNPNPQPSEPSPPHSAEAERAIIASLMVDEDALPAVRSVIGPQDFYYDAHSLIYKACVALADRAEPINQITVGCQLADEGHLQEVGGVLFLSELVGGLPTPVGVHHYAKFVRRQAVFRQLIADAAYVARWAYQAGPRLGPLLDEMGVRLQAAREAAAPALGGSELAMTSDVYLGRLVCPNCEYRFAPGRRYSADEPFTCPSCSVTMMPLPEPADRRCFLFLMDENREMRRRQWQDKPAARVSQPGPAAVPPARLAEPEVVRRSVQIGAGIQGDGDYGEGLLRP